jgi:hypothetical protein
MVSMERWATNNGEITQLQPGTTRANEHESHFGNVERRGIGLYSDHTYIIWLFHDVEESSNLPGGEQSLMMEENHRIVTWDKRDNENGGLAITNPCPDDGGSGFLQDLLIMIQAWVRICSNPWTTFVEKPLVLLTMWRTSEKRHVLPILPDMLYFQG